MIFGRGINVHIPSRSDIDKCMSMNCQWVRIDVNWNKIEKSKGSYYWSDIDFAISVAKSKGLNIYASIAYTPSWINSNYRKCPDSTNWCNFCTVFASRYRHKIDVYGIWNEPNLKDFFVGSTKDYIEKLLKPGYNAIKNVDSSLVVAGGELSTASKSSWTSWFSALVNNKNYYDVFSWHIYQKSSDANIFRFKYGKFPIIGWLIPKWRPISWYIKKIKKSKKRLMLTETGLRANSTSQKEMRKQLLFVKDLDEIRKETKSEAIFYYDIKDYKQFRNKWGLFDDLGNAKIAANWLIGGK